MFNHAILRYIGEQGVVSYTIIAYVNTIVVMSMAGIAQGIQPLISFHYGLSLIHIFSVDYYDGGYAMITIKDSGRYLVVPEENHSLPAFRVTWRS